MHHSFDLIVITQSAAVPREALILKQLLEAGAAGIYIRKDEYSRPYMQAIFETIPAKFHERLIIPYIALPNSPDGVRPIVHVKEQTRIFTPFNHPHHTNLSTSIHRISDLTTLAPSFKMCFFSPVFPSISKPSYVPAKPLNEIKIALEQVRSTSSINCKVIALGGIEAGNIQEVMHAGFNGAALFGSLWQKGNPLVTFERIKNRLFRL